MKRFVFITLSICMSLNMVACSNKMSGESSSLQNATSEVTSNDGEMTPMPEGMPPMEQGEGGGGGLSLKEVDSSWIENKITDIQYSNISDTQKLDIYYPNEESSGPYPVVIAIHGGGFMMGSKTGEDVTSMLKATNYGYAVVSVNYRLSNEAVFPAAISDVKAAIRFIKANAEKYNLDANKIAVWGDSSGGNLATLAGTSSDDSYLNGDNTENMEYSSSVNAVVDWFGPMNFLLMDEQFEAEGITPKFGKTSSDTSPESKYIGGNITENVEQTEKANPENYITSDDPYFFIQHGNADANVPLQQSIDLAENLKSVLGEEKVTLEILDGAGHGTAEFDSDENVQKVINFLDSVLK